MAANEAEKVAGGASLVDLQMIGASGRVFMAGESEELKLAQARIGEALTAITGRSARR